MLTLAIANQKGGVAKTTTAINLAYNLADMGRRVLLADLDPQASLSQATGIDTKAGTLADVLGGAQPGRLAMTAIIRPLAERVDLAPSGLELAGCELGLVQRLGRESALKRALANVEGYDLAILDCGPSLGLLVVNALVAAHGVLVPTLPSGLDLRGLRMFMNSLTDIHELNPALTVLGVVVCQYDARLIVHRAALDELQAGGLCVLGIIKKSIQAARTASMGQPITSGELAEQYRHLAGEVDTWVKSKQG